jgi:hypothetical protein
MKSFIFFGVLVYFTSCITSEKDDNSTSLFFMTRGNIILCGAKVTGPVAITAWHMPLAIPHWGLFRFRYYISRDEYWI